MSVETTCTTARPTAAVRADRPGSHEESTDDTGSLWTWSWPQRFLSLALLATAFVVIGGATLELGPMEARLGLASMETVGPFGQVFGGWEPAIWPAKLVPSLIWSWGELWMPTSNSVRWPAVIAGVAIGLILARRGALMLGGRAGVLIGLCWFGSIGLIDRSADAGIDLVTALGTVAALDRLLSRGSGLSAGFCAAFAFLAGGWPPVAVVALTAVVLGRQGATLSWRLLLPPALAAAAWSVWALRVAPTEAWAAALTLPLTQKPAWLMAAGVIALGLPWTPFASLAASRSVRDGWPAPGRKLVIGWLQVAGVCLVAGTAIPGLADAARVPALAGLAVASGAVCERLLNEVGSVAKGARRWFFAAPILLLVVWTIVAVAAGGYLAAAVPYYRSVAVTLMIFAAPAAALAIWSAFRSNVRGTIIATFALAVFIKMAHFGYYSPEWNYRLGQGPWGRAIGQWVPAKWPIYTIHTWRAELAFATGRPFRQLVSPQHLEYQPGEARFVLLLGSEFENWPADAPKLLKVASFLDEYGEPRVLARTPGNLPWTRPVLPHSDE